MFCGDATLSYITTLTEAKIGNPVTRIPNYIFEGDSKIYVFFPENYKSAKVWKDYADKIEAVCEIYSDFTYSGEGHVIGYKTDSPIALDMCLTMNIL